MTYHLRLKHGLLAEVPRLTGQPHWSPSVWYIQCFLFSTVLRGSEIDFRHGRSYPHCELAYKKKKESFNSPSISKKKIPSYTSLATPIFKACVLTATRSWVLQCRVKIESPLVLNPLMAGNLKRRQRSWPQVLTPHLSKFSAEISKSRKLRDSFISQRLSSWSSLSWSTVGIAPKKLSNLRTARK